jgi:peptidyl-prolyl cis-trans isomerase C
VSRVSLVAVFAVASAIIVGCSKGSESAGTPAGPGSGAPLPEMQAAEAAKSGQQAQAPAAAGGVAPAAAKPVPAELPEVLARVNGETISKAEFQRAIASIEQRAGGPLPADRRDQIVRGLLDQMVGIKLLKQEAAARKVVIPDAEIDARIAEIKKQFPSEDVFTQTLSTQKMTLAALRADQRDDLAVNRMLSDALKDKVEASSEQIDTFYKQNLDRFKQPEQVKASHILISVPQGGDEAAKAASRAKADGILKQVKAGKDFAALAKEFSQDPGSAVNGGDLGFFRQGQMVGPFNDVAFKLAPGAVSDLVETQFGFHIIKVVEKKAAQTAPLDEVRPQLKQYLENQNRQRETSAFVAGLRAKGKIEILI